jgi:hypothetical protein
MLPPMSLSPGKVSLAYRGYLSAPRLWNREIRRARQRSYGPGCSGAGRANWAYRPHLPPVMTLFTQGFRFLHEGFGKCIWHIGSEQVYLAHSQCQLLT